MHGANCIAEISESALRRNIRAIRQRVGAVPLCPAVKADAYGHGLDLVLKTLSSEQIGQIAVANLHEAMEARRLGWYRSILCLGAPLAADDATNGPHACRTAIAADIQVTISSPAEAQRLTIESARMARPARVQVKVDSGMGRMGIPCGQALKSIVQISRCSGVVVEGVYTHFATADEADGQFAREQLARFLDLREQIRSRGIRVGGFHAANSAACFRMPEAVADLDWVRPGICLYGYWDGPPEGRPADLTPAMRVTSRFVAVRQLPAGHGVGYGRTFTTQRPTVVGVIPIGYADGYRRLLGNQGVMIIPQTRDAPPRPVPVIGRISMDQTTVDLTDAGDVRTGDPVVVIDDHPASPNSVEAIARQLNTITYEITCLIGRRVQRISV